MTRSKPRVKPQPVPDPQSGSAQIDRSAARLGSDCEASRVSVPPNFAQPSAKRRYPNRLHLLRQYIERRETQKRLETVAPYTVQMGQKLHRAWCSNCTVHGAAILHSSDHATSRTIGDFLGCRSTV